MKPEDKIIYSINIEDIQTVAEDELGRKLKTRPLPGAGHYGKDMDKFSIHL